MTGFIETLSAPLRNQAEASAYLRDKYGIRIAARTLQKRRCIGDGPSFRKVLGRCLYAETDLDNWAAKELGPPVKSTSALTCSRRASAT